MLKMNDKNKNKLIYQAYFENMGNNHHKCRCGTTYRQTLKHGYSNLVSHVLSEHSDYEKHMPSTSSSQSQLGFSASPRARNIYSWLRWICCKGLPFTFVEDPLTRAFTNLDPICRITFMNYMEKVTIKAEKKIADDLPEKFGIIFDGWSNMGTSTHYVAIFACYSKMGELKRPLLAVSPLIDEENYTAQSHVNFIESTKIFNKTKKIQLSL